MSSVKHSGKLTTATASLFWQKFVAKKPFTILNSYVYALFSYSFSFDPCGHCFSVWLPSKVTQGFLYHVIVLQRMKMFPDSIITV